MNGKRKKVDSPLATESFDDLYGETMYEILLRQGSETIPPTITPNDEKYLLCFIVGGGNSQAMKEAEKEITQVNVLLSSLSLKIANAAVGRAKRFRRGTKA